MRNRRPVLARCPECGADVAMRELSKSHRVTTWLFECAACPFVGTRSGGKREAVDKFNASPGGPNE